MTQQEKAKAYDEAIERASKLKHDNAWVTTIFPELKESEDEKIRKAIIEHFKSTKREFPGLTFGGYYYSNVFAYLEKQKEQKPLPQDYDDAFDEFMSHIPEKDPESDTSLYTYEDMEAAIQFGIKWKGEQQPSKWKPSKEQVKQLINAANTWPDSRVGAGLKSLYDDLQEYFNL